QVEASRPEVHELVRRVGADDEDVAVAGLQVLTLRGYPCPPRADDPRLRIGVPVQPGPFARLVVDEEERDAGAVPLAFEPQRSVRRAPLLVPPPDAVHPTPRCAAPPSPAPRGTLSISALAARPRPLAAVLHLAPALVRRLDRDVREQ